MVIRPSAIMLNGVMLSVIVLGVIVLGVVAPSVKLDSKGPWSDYLLASTSPIFKAKATNKLFL